MWHLIMTSVPIQSNLSAPQPEARACPLCGACAADALCIGVIVRCRACSLRFRRELASEREHEFWSGYLNNDTEQGYDSLRGAYYRDLWRAVRRAASRDGKPGRILDVGCVPGLLLERAAADGWEIHGTELTAPLCARTRELCGATMWRGRLEDVDVPESHFDCVVLSEVLRHTHSPRETLAAALRTLRPGGVIVVREIDADHPRHGSRLAKPYSFDMQFFDRMTIGAALEQAGFAEIRTRCGPMSLLTVRSVNRAARRMPRLYSGSLWAFNALVDAKEGVGVRLPGALRGTMFTVGRKVQ